MKRPVVETAARRDRELRRETRRLCVLDALGPTERLGDSRDCARPRSRFHLRRRDQEQRTNLRNRVHPTMTARIDEARVSLAPTRSASAQRRILRYRVLGPFASHSFVVSGVEAPSVIRPTKLPAGVPYLQQARRRYGLAAKLSGNLQPCRQICRKSVVSVGGSGTVSGSHQVGSVLCRSARSLASSAMR